MIDAKFALLIKEKNFPLGDSEKRLHGVVSLTGMDFQKQGRGIFFFCLSSYTGLPKERSILMKSASEWVNPKVGLCGPVCDFGGQVGERHQ